VGVVAASTLLMLAAPAAAASAQGGPACVAFFDGQNVTAFATPDTAKVVSQTAKLQVSAEGSGWQSTADRLAYSIKLEFAGARWTVASGGANGKSWARTIDVAKYATRGSGIYKVVAVSQDSMGATCYGRAYIKVEGDGPLGSDAGKAAAAVGAVGVAGAVASAASAGREITSDVVGEKTTDFLEGPKSEVIDEIPAAAEEKRAQDELWEDAPLAMAVVKFCWPMVAVAAAATIRAMATDAGRHLLSMIKGVGR
jgi:hypothetical protein